MQSSREFQKEDITRAFIKITLTYCHSSLNYNQDIANQYLRDYQITEENMFSLINFIKFQDENKLKEFIHNIFLIIVPKMIDNTMNEKINNFRKKLENYPILNLKNELINNKEIEILFKLSFLVDFIFQRISFDNITFEEGTTISTLVDNLSSKLFLNLQNIILQADKQTEDEILNFLKAQFFDLKTKYLETNAINVEGATVSLLAASAPIVGVVAIQGIGFTSAGIAAGSIAAGMMSSAAIANGGGIATSSLVATLQSIGAVGLGSAIAPAAIFGGIAAFGYFAYKFFKKKENENKLNINL